MNARHMRSSFLVWSVSNVGFIANNMCKPVPDYAQAALFSFNLLVCLYGYGSRKWATSSSVKMPPELQAAFEGNR